MTKEALENLLLALIPYMAVIISAVVGIIKMVSAVISMKNQSKENIEALKEEIKLQSIQLAENIKNNQELQKQILKLAAAVNRIQPEELQVTGIDSKNSKV